MSNRTSPKRLLHVFAFIIAQPVVAADWTGTVHVTMVEPTCAPILLTLTIDAAVGSCGIGAILSWTPQGATTEERIASYDATFATLLAAQASDGTVTLSGNNAGCQITSVRKN